jgi:hypothetical protein
MVPSERNPQGDCTCHFQTLQRSAVLSAGYSAGSDCLLKRARFADGTKLFRALVELTAQSPSYWRESDTCESVVAPLLRADTVVNVEQSKRVVPSLDLGQARIVFAPERTLPVPLEIVRLVNV